MAKTCVSCGAPLPVQTGRGRRRTKCVGCSPSRGKAAQREAKAPTHQPNASAGLLAATKAELDAAGVASTSAGQSALLLAERIEFGENSGSAVAMMVRQLHDTMTRALAREAVAVDPVDDLRARREARRGA